MSDNKLFLLFYYLTIAGFILSSEANSDSNYATFPGRENGTCYKRVPYDDALISKLARGLVEVLPGSEQAGVKTGNVRGWLSIIECCDGFKRNNITRECETHCDNGCVGGTCTGPNICTCEDGWRYEYGECKPMCRRGCHEHAYCFSPDVCSCEFGYQEVNGECQPVCLNDCLNGDCVAPRECRCHHGYFLNETKMCEPSCEGGCPHGNCEKPGICACNYGFIHPPGTQESCVPYCPETCKNGMCHSPGICTCNEGYSRNSSGFCVPECKNGCDNGKCIAPEQCRCDLGFVMNHESQKCVEYNSAVLSQNFTSSSRANFEPNVHIKAGQREIYRPMQTQAPQRVIGLNETQSQTQNAHRRNESETNYRIAQTHESQGSSTPQRHPTQTSYGTHSSDQIEDAHGSRDSYRNYGENYQQEHVSVGNYHITQNSRQNMHEIRDPYRQSGIHQAYEPQRTITIHEISQPEHALPDNSETTQNPRDNLHEISDPYRHQIYEPQRTLNTQEVNRRPEHTTEDYRVTQNQRQNLHETRDSYRDSNSRNYEPQRTLNTQEVNRRPEHTTEDYRVMQNQRQNLHETRDSYRDSDSRNYEPQRTVNIHEVNRRPEYGTESYRVTQNQQQNLQIIHDSYRHSETSQTHESQQNMHQINPTPDAIIIITPSVSPIRCTNNCQSALDESTARTIDYNQRNIMKNSNARPNNNQMHINPEIRRFNMNTTQEVYASYNPPRGNTNLHENTHNNNNNEPCDSESDEDDESDLYDPNSYHTQQVSCQLPCINGICVGKNQCQCKSGYRVDPKSPLGHVCLPYCQKDCLNGVCTAPGLCICKAGFSKQYGRKDSNICAPID